MVPKIELTPEISDRICIVIRNGGTQEMAAGMARVSQSTLARWLRAGRDDPDGEYADFAADYMEAEAKAHGDMNKVIWDEAIRNENWQAASWWLGRRNNRYKPKTEVDQTAKVEISGAPTVADAQRIMREEFGGVTPDTETEEE